MIKVLPSPVLAAMRIQLDAMKPVLGDPLAMAQAWAKEVMVPGYVAATFDNFTAAVIIKRALTDPVASAAVSQILAAQDDHLARQVALDLAGLRQSLGDKADTHAEFLRLIQPLERLGTSEHVQEALDSIFSRSVERTGRSYDVLAENTFRHAGDKIDLPLKPAPNGSVSERTPQPT